MNLCMTINFSLHAILNVGVQERNQQISGRMLLSEQSALSEAAILRLESHQFSDIDQERQNKVREAYISK